MDTVLKNIDAIRPDERNDEAGYVLLEHMGGYTFYMIMIAAAALLLVILFGDS